MDEREREILHRMLALIEGYREEVARPGARVVEYRPAEELRKELDLGLPEGEGSAEGMFRGIEQYLRWAVRTAHPGYLNQLWGGFTLAGFLGEVFTSLTNTSMYTYEVAPGATLLEHALVERLCRLAGYPEGEGLFVTGASNANLVAMLVARDRAFPQAAREGLTGEPVAFVSDQAHYSFLKAAVVLGIGARNLVRVPSDPRGRMIPGALASAVQESRRQGREPFFVAATAGTTVLGAFDPVEEVAEVAGREGLWLHVDGALGGSVLVSRRHRHLLRGLERSDSFAWNLHKMMGVPLMASLIFTREKGRLGRACGGGRTEYIFHDHADAAWDLGPRSLQCGRKVDVLKVWLSWRYFGEAGYERRMDRLFDLARHAEGIVQREPRLELLAERQSIAVCFRVVPPAGVDPDRFNVEVRQRLLREGRAMVNYSRLGDGRVAIRLVLVNPDLTEGDVERFFEAVLEAAGVVAGG